MGRRPCCWKEGLRKGAWSPLEDTILTNFINTHGTANWRDLPQRAGLERCGKSCRLRWLNYLKPDIKRGSISPDEEDLIFRLHNLLGNRWSLIAGRLPGRTDNEIKNYWNCKLRKIDKNDDHDKKINDSDDDENHNNKVVRTRAVRLTRPINIITQPHNLWNEYGHQNQKVMMIEDQDYQKSSRDNIQDDYVINKQLIDDDVDSIEAAAMMENWMSSWDQNGEDSLIGLMDFNDLELDNFLNSEYDHLF